MNNIQIFVEGIADQKFFQDLIHEWYDVKPLKENSLKRTPKLS